MSTRMTASSLSVTTTSTALVAADKERNYLYLRNTSGSETVYIKPDAAHSGTEGKALAPGAVWEPGNAPINVLYLKGSGSATVEAVLGRHPGAIPA